VLPSSSLSGLRPSNLSASFQVVPALFHGPAPAVHVLLPEQKPSLHLPQDRPPLVSFRVQRAVNTTCKHHACLSLRAHEQAKILLRAHTRVALNLFACRSMHLQQNKLAATSLDSLTCKPSYICAVILQVVVAQNQHQRCCLHH